VCDGLMNETEGHWIAVELASVGGDGGFYHADESQDIEEDGEDDES